jgi:two-component system response regulator ChvI
MLRRVSQASPETSDSEAASDAEAIRILIVDDEPQLLRLIGRVLSRGGYEVQDAVDGKSAREAIAAAPPKLAIIDLSVPPEGGAALMRELQGAVPGICIVLTSGGDLGTELRFELAAAGGSFLRKPFAPRVLSEMVSRSLAGESHPDGFSGSY